METALYIAFKSISGRQGKRYVEAQWCLQNIYTSNCICCILIDLNIVSPKVLLSKTLDIADNDLN